MRFAAYRYDHDRPAEASAMFALLVAAGLSPSWAHPRDGAGGWLVMLSRPDAARLALLQLAHPERFGAC
jgi:hypothetical protein